jgi:hypothetical protein
LDLSGANLSGADFTRAMLVQAKLHGADLTGARIYGISAWNVSTNNETKQEGLVITASVKAVITVDNLKVAQFIYLILNNDKIRNVLDTITRKVVLILGRFTEDRMAVLDAIADQLRELKCLPVIFKFEPSPERNILDTVRILAHMSRFVIMDFTDAKFILAEAAAVVKINVVIQPIIKVGQELGTIRGILADAQRMLDLHEYHDVNDLLPALRDTLLPAAEKMAEHWTKRRDEWSKSSKTAENVPPE